MHVPNQLCRVYASRSSMCGIHVIHPLLPKHQDDDCLPAIKCNVCYKLRVIIYNVSFARRRICSRCRYQGPTGAKQLDGQLPCTTAWICPSGTFSEKSRKYPNHSRPSCFGVRSRGERNLIAADLVPLIYVIAARRMSPGVKPKRRAASGLIRTST